MALAEMGGAPTETAMNLLHSANQQSQKPTALIIVVSRV
jgi:hypothetical protein